MRGQAWRLEARRLVVVACVGALIGFIFGEIGWGLSIGLAIYSSWIVLQVRRVDNWFAGASDDIPEAVGVWGSLQKTRSPCLREPSASWIKVWSRAYSSP